ncbi:ShlB/FhaC/HecB family hemolysin secretion/activation protein [Proteus penneri]|uniref:Hemolysin transporter protein ShlB n=1 Tax=Proteus penneri TaxID=102862 RepID=A0A0G4QGV1_9GAMM|nr:ShlB/FhaC/HecB family hemolysin secretion/activation protein [Proteus penneri]CRL65083.1 Hemolysin transporter protein ShlB precursor [Proteus penneri]
MNKHHYIKWGLFSFYFLSIPLIAVPYTSPIPAEQAVSIDDREQQRQKERERILQQQNRPDIDTRLSHSDIELPDYPINEKPCFWINTFTLEGEASRDFQWTLKAVDDAKDHCLGGQGVLLVVNKIQNEILSKGYVTTRVMVQEQDLTQGHLTLTLQPGRIHEIRFDDNVSWRARLWNVIPTSSGNILNLRDIEQGLENFKRVPNVTANIQIVPGKEDATSDLVVSWQEQRPIRLSLGLDDSGSKSTGRYLGSATLAIDAPFSQNDLFYANVGKDYFDNGPFGNRSYTFNYFIPVGNWGFAANYNHYTYHQNIPNANEILRYSGESDNTQFTVSRLLFRNQFHKTTLNMRVYRKHSTNAVNGIDIDQQHRRTAGWEIGFNQRSYFGNATLDANLNWRRGTGAFGALRAPEEDTHSGSARTGLFLGDIGFNQPFALGEQPWRWNTSLRGQWSQHALTPQDRMAIGGRYTVRGFDGEQMLSGEKAILLRNDIAWNVFSKGQELYLGLDYGRVEGQSTRYLVGHQLAGTALGLRGALWSQVSYDVFAGIPLYKPEGFHTSGATAGFSLNIEI